MSDKNENLDQSLDMYSSGASSASHSNNDEVETVTNTRSGEDDSEQDDGREENDPIDSKESIKDREAVLMYLPEGLKRDLDIQFDELNAEHKRQHQESLEKNRDYYPAVVLAGLTGDDLETILDL